MMRTLSLTLSMSLVFLLPACGGDHDHDHAHPHPHPGENAAAGGHMDDHGTRHELGTVKIGAFEFVASTRGEIAPGKEVVAQADFAAGKPLPKTMRVWIGEESGTGSMKARMEIGGDEPPHAHFDAPAAFAEGAKLWFEIEHDGKTERGSIAWQ